MPEIEYIGASISGDDPTAPLRGLRWIAANPCYIWHEHRSAAVAGGFWAALTVLGWGVVVWDHRPPVAPDPRMVTFQTPWIGPGVTVGCSVPGVPVLTVPAHNDAWGLKP